MVLLTLSRKLNQLTGPFLLRNGLRARYALAVGALRDNPYLDMMLLLNWSQKIISIEVAEDAKNLIKEVKKPSKLDQWMSSTFDAIFGADEIDERRKRAPISELRMEVLERYLRPALVKDERWHNVHKWRFHKRLVKWARSEFLKTKYKPAVQEALEAYPELRFSPQLTPSPARYSFLNLLRGNLVRNVPEPKMILPSKATLQNAFGMQRWTSKKDTTALRKHMERLANGLDGQVFEIQGGSMRFAEIPLYSDLSKLPIEQVLEVAGGHVEHCGPFNALCEEADIFQMWTKEYVRELGKYILERASQFEGKTVILDVGAGDGLLAHFLKDHIEREFSRQERKRKQKGSSGQKRAPPTVVATDDGSWKIAPKAMVERMNVADALTRFRQDGQQVIVICSWMPMGEDWSEAFRKAGVDEYILIGECDDGSCGDNWKTWGNDGLLSDVDEELNAIAKAVGDDGEDAVSESSSEPKPTTKLYEADGYRRKDMTYLLQYQFSRFDCALSKNGATVSFRKTS